MRLLLGISGSLGWKACLQVCLAALLSAFWVGQALAFNCQSNATGNWGTAATWTGCNGTIPQNGDSVTILNGHAVTLNTNTNTLASLVVSSGGTLTTSGTSGSDIYLGGNLVNNGTLNMQASTGTNTIYLAGTSVTSTFSGTGTWLLDDLDLNGLNPRLCNVACKVELSGSPNLQFYSATLFSGNSATYTFNAGANATATVTFVRPGSQTVSTTGVTYPNMVLAGTGTKTSSAGTLKVLGSMTVSNNTTFNANTSDPVINISGGLTINSGGTYTASNSGAVTIAGNFTNSGTYTGNSGAMTLKGNLTSPGTFTSGSATWTFNGSGAQSLSGPTSFTRVVLNNASGLTISNTVTVSTAFTFASGTVTTGGGSLILSASCRTSYSRTSGYVIGRLELHFPAGSSTCTFPIGSAGGYTPVTTAFTGVTSSLLNSALTASTTDGDHADTTADTSGIDASKSVNRYWTLTGGGSFAFTNYSITLNFLAGDIDAGANTGNFIVARKSGGTWSYPALGALTVTSSQATGLTQAMGFGEFAVGESRNRVDHYAISHGGSGVNCQGEPVTVSAHDATHAAVVTRTTITLTTTTSHGDWILQSGTGLLTNSGNGLASYIFNNESSVQLLFRDTFAETTNINVTDGTATEHTGTALAAEDRNLSFARSGFSIVDSTGAAIDVGTQVAGKDSDAAPGGQVLYLQAVRSTGGGACQNVFANGSTVQIGVASQCNDPTTCAGKNVTVTTSAATQNSVAVSSNPNSTDMSVPTNGSYSAVNFRFVTVGANILAPFKLNYPDVGQIKLLARYLITPPGTQYMVGSSNSFVVKPDHVTISGIKCTTADAANCGAGALPSGNNPGAADASGLSFIQAGNTFSVTVAANDINGNATPNFGREVTAEGVKLTSALVAPSGGAAGALSGTASIAGGSFSSGAVTVTDLAWSEVGVITLTPSIADGSYLGTGDVTGTASGNIGRFTPHHFAVTPAASDSLVDRADINTGSSETCASTFTYLGEDFKTAFTLTAQNAASGTTRNYTGTFAKLGLATWGGFGFSAAGLPAGSSLAAGATAPAGSWSNGVADVLAAHKASRPTSPAAPTASAIVSAQPVDSDGVGMNSAAVVHTGTATLRYGRLRLQNAHGSELLQLPVPAEAQYWTAGSYWATNTLDSCTSIASANLAISPAITSLSASPVTLAGGKGTLLLAKPSSAGTAALCIDLGPDSTEPGVPPALACTATSAGMAYLQGNRYGTLYDDDPAAKVTFGVYKNANEFIYMRENYY